ncbi:MAG: aldehyde dehydrogenase family protein [Candidatus Acidiferrales bacterium]
MSAQTQTSTIAPDSAAPSSGAGFVASIDAASGRVVAQIPATSPDSAPRLMAHAREAQKSWAAKSLRERCSYLRKLRDAIYDRRDEVTNAISLETGKPHVEAVFAELMLALDSADFLARQAPEWLRPEPVPHHNIGVKAKSGSLYFQPFGVLAIISPWNYPFSIPMAQILPALVAGNAVLLKPSELTPHVGEVIAKIIAAAGIPSGVVQVLQGGGAVGAALLESNPDKVFFTGSVATGKRIAEACARRLIPSSLELGGKDAMLVLADADLEIASSAAVWGGFMNCGQTCISVERIYVEQAIAQPFLEKCLEKTRKLRLGPPSDKDAEIGPMIRVTQLEKVEQQLRDATARGAQVLTGGNRRDDLGPSFLEPTVVTNVDHSMQLMREETFGPVIAIRPVKSADEAVALANDSEFALSASVWTSNASKGQEIAQRIRGGSVMINDVASYYGICEAPHGGSGASGWGRSHSRFGLLEMVQVKYVDVDRLPRTPKSWWFGYNENLAAAADSFVDYLFAPRWSRRMAALANPRGVAGTVFRRHRI